MSSSKKKNTGKSKEKPATSDASTVPSDDTSTDQPEELKTTIAAEPEKRKRGRQPKSGHENSKGKESIKGKEVADDKNKEEQEPEDAPSPKRAKTEEDTTPSEGRVKRERKATVQYNVDAPSKTPKKIEIPEGKGQPLKDIQAIHDVITTTRASDEVLKGFHSLIWGRAAHKHLKQDLLNFKGFNFQSDKEHDVVLRKLEKWMLTGLKDLSHLLCLETSGTKEVIVERIFKFLQEPSEEAIKPGSKKKQSSKPAKKDAAKDAPKKRMPKPKPKTAFEIFVNEKREEVTKELGEGAETEAIDKQLDELFQGLSDEQKTAYEQKLEEAQKVKAKKHDAVKKASGDTKQKKRAARSKKPAEIVETEEDEENEDKKEGMAPPAKKGKPPKKKNGSSKGPTDAKIEKEIKRILNDANLQDLTSKKVRSRLQEVFHCDLSEKKEFIKEKIDQWLGEQE
ncbi:hypothetical protein SpCBS45565_g06121 [Spizellomyces sp. 'palustris']|nr:hypothetical protein SpCBS45565_g06121 [Spizellomyces sp. 'palustris']